MAPVRGEKLTVSESNQISHFLASLLLITCTFTLNSERRVLSCNDLKSDPETGNKKT